MLRGFDIEGKDELWVTNDVDECGTNLWWKNELWMNGEVMKW